MLSLCSEPNHSLTCAWIERRDKGKAWMWPWFPVLFQQHKPSKYSKRHIICILPLKQNSCHELRDISKTIWVIGKDRTKILDQKLFSIGKGTTSRKINRADLRTKLCMVLCVTLWMNEWMQAPRTCTLCLILSGKGEWAQDMQKEKQMNSFKDLIAPQMYMELPREKLCQMDLH